MKKTYTDKQGQYLAFIYYYSKIHGCSPSEAEMQQYFRVSLRQLYIRWSWHSKRAGSSRERPGRPDQSIC